MLEDHLGLYVDIGDFVAYGSSLEPVVLTGTVYELADPFVRILSDAARVTVTRRADEVVVLPSRLRPPQQHVPTH